MSDQATHPKEKGGQKNAPDGKIFIWVNEKQITLQGKKHTGEDIKKAAIDQLVNIQMDFVLSIERGSGKTELIGDGDEIEVEEGDRFLAIPNDDNS